MTAQLQAAGKRAISFRAGVDATLQRKVMFAGTNRQRIFS
jgi:hypothetical protein